MPEQSIGHSLPPAFGSTMGLRPWLASKGITYQFAYVSEVLGNPTGGPQQKAVYGGRLEAAVDADLEKLTGWKGATARVSGFQLHGQGLTTHYLGNIFPISNVEALRGTRLFEAWIEQKLFNDTLSVKFGQITADSDFLAGSVSGIFMNAAFGWPAIAAADMPSGGLACPLAAPGIRFKYDATPNQSYLVAVFNGDPAGRGPAHLNPQLRNPHGLIFPVNDPPVVMTEAQFKHSAIGLPGMLKLGWWTHFGTFDDRRFDGNGVSLADTTLSTGNPRRHRFDHGIYSVVDQQLWQLPGGQPDQGISSFFRASWSPPDRNLIDLDIDVGLTFKGLVPRRPDDAFGVAIGFARISPAVRAFDIDTALFTGVRTPFRDFEAVIEATYQAQVSPGFTIQPDFQYIFRPGGNVADSTGLRPVRNAAVFGLRAIMRY
ncbi:carbohydrate porin [Bradyrhizobium sp.]|uniref:carbohydrate porin n=1 Tax=Bradyrhizobium sp. TaxID=376 RepID=UPI0025BBC542|nr:carbohydrate porin [Bradyrhizobium sp.]